MLQFSLINHLKSCDSFRAHTPCSSLNMSLLLLLYWKFSLRLSLFTLLRLWLGNRHVWSLQSWHTSDYTLMVPVKLFIITSSLASPTTSERDDWWHWYSVLGRYVALHWLLLRPATLLYNTQWYLPDHLQPPNKHHPKWYIPSSGVIECRQMPRHSLFLRAASSSTAFVSNFCLSQIAEVLVV